MRPEGRVRAGRVRGDSRETLATLSACPLTPVRDLSHKGRGEKTWGLSSGGLRLRLPAQRSCGAKKQPILRKVLGVCRGERSQTVEVGIKRTRTGTTNEDALFRQ